MSKDKLESSATVEDALSVIDRLLRLPMGDQLYAKEIKRLFDLISVQQYPPIVVKSTPSNPQGD